MSASEKLKALEAQIDRAEGITSLRPAGWILTDALPQIVAVVEAAQQIAAWVGVPRNDEEQLRAALTALDEELS